MAKVSASEYSIVRGGNGVTGPQLSTLIAGTSYSTCYDFCKDLMLTGMKVTGGNATVTWASCNMNQNGNAESFTSATVNGHTDTSKIREGLYVSYNWYGTANDGDRIADCLGIIFFFKSICLFTNYPSQ